MFVYEKCIDIIIKLELLEDPKRTVEKVQTSEEKLEFKVLSTGKKEVDILIRKGLEHYGPTLYVKKEEE